MRWTTTDQAPALPGLFDEPDAPGFDGLEFLHVRAKSILNPIPSGMPARWSINVYRGCSHACTYCFARPTHAHLGLDVEGDFDRRIVVKVNAAAVLRRELRRPSWQREHVALGTNTDPYQRAEARYRLTRACLVALHEHATPFSVLTKGTAVLKDLDVLTAAHAAMGTRVNVSIPTLDAEVAAAAEPGAPTPRARLRIVRELRAAGIPSAVFVAPLLPGMTDDDEQLRPLVEAALEAGADGIVPIPLQLRHAVRPGYLRWLADHRPDLVERHVATFRRPDGTWIAHQPARAREQVARRVRRIVDDATSARGGRRGATARHPDRADTPNGRLDLVDRRRRDPAHGVGATTTGVIDVPIAASPRRDATGRTDADGPGTRAARAATATQLPLL